MEYLGQLWSLLFSFFSWFNLNQGFFVACTTVILLITNWWTLRHYKRQYELDRFLVFMPLKEENLLNIKKFFNKLPLHPNPLNVTNFHQHWSYSEKGKSNRKLNEKPMHKDAQKIISDLTYAKHLFSKNSDNLEKILRAIQELDETIRKYEIDFPTDSFQENERKKQENMISEYTQIILLIKSEMEKFINEAEYQKPPK